MSWHIFIQCSKLTILLLQAITIMQLCTPTMAMPDISVGDLGVKTDLNALLAIKGQLVDVPVGGVLSSWNQSIHHCKWDGVICGRKHNRVIELELQSRGLSGTISPFIGNLSFLQEIALFNNSLYGPIPPEIGRLFRLQRLGLKNNTLTGEIPANLSGCTKLQILSLGWNKLEGHVPIELKDLSRLVHFAVPGNRLTGSLFKVIQNLTSLEGIYAAYNLFTGNIPESIGNMRNLTKVGLAENLLSGGIPPSIFNLSSLQALELAENQLEGSLPTNINLKLPQIQVLNLGSNYLSGPFPVSFLNFTKLQFLSLAGSKFTGRVLLDFRHFQNLVRLELSNMNLEGDCSFIATLSNCSIIENIQLHANNFTGTLQGHVANLSTTLSWFQIGQNQLSGSIPSGFGNLYNLAFLRISENEFTGTIPDELGKLRKLEQMDLSYNRLTGIIPNSLGNLSRLSRLYLDDNKLQGSIPPHLGNCQNLLYLGLSNNDLNETLPDLLFRGSAQFLELDISHNHLRGSLPQSISNQINLVAFDMSENKFSGEIPNGLGKCSALQNLGINDNSIHGSIPQSFSALSSLQILDLSRNNLSGLLPIYFSAFPLVYLNLSYNDFEGSIPERGIYANLSVVSVVGNSRLCGGILQLHLPRCLEEGRRKNNRRMSHVLKLTIPIICALVGLVILAVWLYLTRRRKRWGSIPTILDIEKGFLKVSYSMLLKATDEFSSSNLLGAGTFGTVFKGVLDGNMVAVKVLNLQKKGASKSFMAECKALKITRHRNLVKIITVCSSSDYQQNDFKALVYEFMPNGNLDSWLHKAGNLSLLQRMDIALDVAHALNYLHHENETTIVHCDLRPNNILLDDDMVAHVGDFGLAKVFAETGFLNQSSSIGVHGTVGYTAPEYGLGNEASTDGDIYSYGTLLLELLTGKRPTDDIFNDDSNLHMYATAALPDQVLQIVDPALDEEDNRMAIQDTAELRVECMTTILSVGVACSNHFPQNRMKISDAITRLRTARDNLLRAERRSLLHYA